MAGRMTQPVSTNRKPSAKNQAGFKLKQKVSAMAGNKYCVAMAQQTQEKKPMSHGTSTESIEVV